MEPINASIAVSASSGAQGGNISNGDFIIGGSGGASKQQIPTVLIVVVGAVALLGLLFWMLKK
jgi:hypothetical protein